MKTVNEMKAQINALNAQIFKIEKDITDENTVILMEEIANFRDEVGDGYTDGDDYAPDRYYSRIPGVKNLRFYCGGIEAKITSQIGCLLPDSVEIDGKTYEIHITTSRNFESGINY